MSRRAVEPGMGKGLGGVGRTSRHQENPKSASTKLEALGIMTEYIFSYLPVPRAPDLDRVDNAHARNKHYSIQKYTIQSFRGAHRCASMDQTFRRKRICKKCPGRIAPNRLEADGADCGSTEADRLYTIA